MHETSVYFAMLGGYWHEKVVLAFGFVPSKSLFLYYLCIVFVFSVFCICVFAMECIVGHCGANSDIRSAAPEHNWTCLHALTMSLLKTQGKIKGKINKMYEGRKEKC